MIGTKLAHYKVTAALGVGGMGEVWRAEDEKLGREVALKVLPEEFAEDPERMARFEREAKVLASLNHPNIAHLYGLESVHTQMAAGTAAPQGTQADEERLVGQASRLPDTDAGLTTFLVMELVEGEDLSERIKRGPVPMEEATAIALQIAEALEAAHESGIVHRDLKPANIKLRPDGTVKVLDFGLAKAWETDHLDSSISMSPTLTQHATAAGIILGTAAYMAPEQAAGIAADRRADVWAFGVVFWEMLTGHKLFDGETVSHILASVLKDEVDLDELPPGTPAPLTTLIGRCLRKKPKQRLQAIGDARVVLEEYIADPESSEALAAADGVPAAVIPPWRRLLPWAATAVLALALAAVVFLRPSPHDPAVRFQIVAPDNLTEVGPPTISPDGRTIAFDATDEKGTTLIWVRSMDDLQARPLAGTDGATRPFWSPDSRYLAFIAGGKLKKVPLAGGPPQTLADTPTGSDGAWSSRGEILFDGRSGDPIRRVAASGGTPQDLITADPEDGIISVGWPQFLPDGRRFLYVANGAETDERFLMVGNIEGKEPPRKLLDVSSLVRLAPPDHLLYVREDSLLAQSFNFDSAELTGEAVPLAEELGASSTGLSDFSASKDGTLVYRSGWTAERRLVWTDRNGRELGDADRPAVYRETALSPDGTRLAMTIEDSQSDNRDIWVRDLERGVTSRFTFDPGRDSAPVWSPDGTRIVFSSNRDDGSYGLFVKDATGGGQAEEVPNSGPSGVPCDWSRDGRWLAFHANQEDTGWDLWVLAMEGEEAGTATPFVQGRFTEVLPRFSPDGRWIAYISNESGRMEVYVQPFPGPGGKWQISTDGGREPQWSDDGREIRYVSPGGVLMSAAVTTGPAFTAGTPRELFDVRLQPIVVRNRWLATPDGERFLFLQPQGSNRSLPMTVVLDWAEALPER